VGDALFASGIACLAEANIKIRRLHIT
jgi:hypothetical protein